MNQPAIDRFWSLPEDDRQMVLREILDTRSWSLEPDVLGILKLALDRGVPALTEKQAWRLILGGWVPNVAVECSRDFSPLPPEEMVQATLQGGRCSYCEHMWRKIQEE